MPASSTELRVLPPEILAILSFPAPELPCRRFAKEKLQAQANTRIKLIVVLFIERNQWYDFVVKPLTAGLFSVTQFDNVLVDVGIRLGVEDRRELVLYSARRRQALRQVTADPGAVSFLVSFLTAPAPIKGLAKIESVGNQPVQVQAGIELPVIVGLPAYRLGESVRSFFTHSILEAKPRTKEKCEVIELHTQGKTGIPAG